ncbi:MAG: SGNH/GDSL hydrolase family protein [Gemmatimonadota bacterium]
MTSFRALVAAALRALRDGWIVVGLSFALLVAIEAVYRSQSAARLAIGRRLHPAPPEPPNPFDRTPWAAAYSLDEPLEGHLLWKPYVYLRNPSFTGRVVSVDTAGHRTTTQTLRTGTKPLDVYFFGGSTAWGWLQRDSFTIASEMARRFSSANVRVTNFGVPGFVFTQELLELQLQLRAGHVPDVVVFYDGVNDVWATLQDDVAGLTENEANRARDFAEGRRRVADSVHGVFSDVKALGRAGLVLGDRLRFVKRLRGRRPPYPARISADSATNSTWHVYAETARIAESLAQRYGFTIVYVWQPSLLSSRKRQTAREGWLVGDFADSVFGTRFRDVMLAIPAPLTREMANVAPGRFLDLTTLFDRDTGEVYVDVYGHTYESANPVLVEAMRPLLSSAIADSSARTARRKWLDAGLPRRN